MCINGSRSNAIEDAYLLLENHVVREVNQNFLKLCGYESEEVLGKSLVEISDLLRISYKILSENCPDDIHYLIFSKAYEPLEVDIKHTTDEHTHENKITFMKISSRKQLEEEQKQCEDMYKALFNNLVVGHAYYEIITDESGKPVDYIVSEVNPAYEIITGLKAVDLVGNRATELYPHIKESSTDWIGLFGEVALTGKPMAMEVYSDIMDRWYSVNYYCPKPGYTASIFSDITSTKADQEEAQTAKIKLLEAQELAHLGNWTCDVVNNTTYWADEIYRIYGLSPQECTPDMNVYFKYVHPDDRAAVEHFAEQLLLGKADNMTFRYIGCNNKSGWIRIKSKASFDSHGNLTALSGTLQDITDKIIIEEELRSSREKLDFILKNVDCAIFQLDQEGVILFSGGKGIYKTCLQPEVSKGQSIFEIYKEDTRILEALGKVFLNLESVTVESNVDNCVFETRLVPIVDKTGKINSVIGVALDISKRKELERELILSRDEAAKASEAKGRFLANMSHEIRTPMNGIMGIMQLMEMTTLTDEQKEYIRLAKSSSDLLLMIINDILDYSKLEAGMMPLEKIAFEPERVLIDAIKLFQHTAAKKGIVLSFIIEENVPQNLIGDSFRLRQILSNIIGNAVKFTSEGSVHITVKKMAETDPEKAVLKFIISDTGIGIPPEKQDVLFKSFSQVEDSTTRQYGGTGLGLVISKALAKMMNGDIWLDSVEGVGSRFYFTCMMDVPDELKHNGVQEDAMNEKSKSENTIRLLLAEDDETSSFIIQKFINRKGWQLQLVENGQAAIEAYKRERFDAILMDVQMPVVNGYDAAVAIRALEKKSGTYTPIIAVTSNALKGDREKCISSGMDDYLSKPVNANEFYEIVSRWKSKE